MKYLLFSVLIFLFPRILEKQTPNVDAVSGASTTSKALMKAVENSLATKKL